MGGARVKERVKWGLGGERVATAQQLPLPPRDGRRTGRSSIGPLGDSLVQFRYPRKLNAGLLEGSCEFRTVPHRLWAESPSLWHLD